MMVRLFRRTSDGRLISYLSGGIDGAGMTRSFGPQLLDGNPLDFQAFIDTCSFENIYLSGAFSWGEDLEEVGLEKAMQVVDDGLNVICRDTQRNDRLQLVYLHRRKKGFDIHFAIGRTHLRTGREFPYFTNSELDWKTLKTWRRLTNLQYGSSDPADPSRRRLNKPPHPFLKGSHRAEYIAIEELTTELVINRWAISRDDVISCLRMDGYVVTTTHNSIQIHHDGKLLKFYGPKYREGTNYEALLARIGPTSRPSPDEVAAEIADLARELPRLRLERQERSYRFVAQRDFIVPPRIAANLRDKRSRLLHPDTAAVAGLAPQLESGDVAQGGSIPPTYKAADEGSCDGGTDAYSLRSAFSGPAPSAPTLSAGLGGAAEPDRVCRGYSPSGDSGRADGGKPEPRVDDQGLGAANRAPEPTQPAQGPVRAGAGTGSSKSMAPADGAERPERGQLDSPGDDQALNTYDQTDNIIEGIGRVLRRIGAALRGIEAAARSTVQGEFPRLAGTRRTDGTPGGDREDPAVASGGIGAECGTSEAAPAGHSFHCSLDDAYDTFATHVAELQRCFAEPKREARALPSPKPKHEPEFEQ